MKTHENIYNYETLKVIYLGFFNLNSLCSTRIQFFHLAAWYHNWDIRAAILWQQSYREMVKQFTKYQRVVINYN